MIVTIFMNSIWFFKRGGRGDDLEPFFKNLDKNFDWFLTARQHLSCFPEGHRSVKPYMLPLKEGMTRYAYERDLLVQPVILFGVENAMNEFTLRRSWSDKCVIEYYVCDVIDPKDFKPSPGSNNSAEGLTREAFHKKIQDTMYEEFDRNYQMVSEFNKREKFLRAGQESELYQDAKDGNKSYAMWEYAIDKRKKKRH